VVVKALKVKATDATESSSEHEAAKAAESIAGKLAVAYAAVTAVLGFIGIKEGSLDAILRDDPRPSLFFFTMIGLSIAIGIGFGLIPPKSQVRFGRLLTPLLVVVVALLLYAQFIKEGDNVPDDVQWWAAAIAGLFIALIYNRVAPTRIVALAFGIALFMFGMFGLFKLGVDSKSATARPRITATLTDDAKGLLVEGSVKTGGLRKSDHVLIRVEGIPVDASRLSAGTTESVDTRCAKRCELLSGQWIGADAEGAIDAPVKVRTAIGRFARINITAEVSRFRTNEPRPCDEKTPGYGCLSLFLPSDGARPLVTPTWTVTDDAAKLELVATADGLEPGQRLRIEVFQPRARAWLVRAFAPPLATGAMETKLTVTPARDGGPVCIRTRTVGRTFQEKQQPRVPRACVPTATMTTTELAIPAA
jgi:hypothetical protein